MNKENAKLKLPIIQSFVEGKKIQCRNDDGSWYTITELNSYLDDDQGEYRIKPKKKLKFKDAYTEAMRVFDNTIAKTEKTISEFTDNDNKQFYISKLRWYKNAKRIIEANISMYLHGIIDE